MMTVRMNSESHRNHIGRPGPNCFLINFLIDPRRGGKPDKSRPGECLVKSETRVRTSRHTNVNPVVLALFCIKSSLVSGHSRPDTASKRFSALVSSSLFCVCPQKTV